MVVWYSSPHRKGGRPEKTVAVVTVVINSTSSVLLENHSQSTSKLMENVMYIDCIERAGLADHNTYRDTQNEMTE